MNLILIAMEGVSQTLFWQYRDSMPTLWDIHNRSASFRRFYTNSTSALSSLYDLVYGNSSLLDHHVSYEEALTSPCLEKQDLFGLLRAQGYETLGLVRATSQPKYMMPSFNAAGPFHWHQDSETCCAEGEGFIERCAASKTPFTLYVSEKAARLDDEHPGKRKETTLHGRVEKGYQLLDQTVGRIFSKLAEHDLTRDTIAICLGLYGTDPWKHGMHAGRTHAFEPYADLCWTPMFMYRNDFDICVSDQIISMVDIRPTILQMLFPDESIPNPDDRVSGLNAFSGFTRQIAFSQSLFATEKENLGASLGLIKSYAVTDGAHRLIVSSDGGIKGDGGMEFYLDFHDPSNTRNFLDFFQLNTDGEMVSFGKNDLIHPHFTASFKAHLVMDIVKSYTFLRSQLQAYIQEKESIALKRNSEQRGELFPLDMFTHARRRS